MARQPALALAGVPRVNLMPRVEIEHRERASLTRVWAVLVVVALAVALVIIAGALFVKVTADAQLAAAQARASELIVELASHSEVSAAMQDVQTLEGFRAGALSNDVAWTPLVERITGALPSGVTLTELAITPGPPAVGEDPSAVAGPAGTLTLSSKVVADQAETVAALVAVDGVLAADAWTLSSGAEDTYSFAVAITFDQSVYAGGEN